jgi:SagB-type dehydrogenase family enzyme
MEDLRMTKKSVLFICIFLVMNMVSAAGADDLQPIQLLPPQIDGGKPLMQALQKRSTSRDFSPDQLPPQVLSNLLWAAYGINRPEIGKRTVPSALNWQEIDLYVSMVGGLYLYDAKTNRLKPILNEDIRHLTGKQPFVKTAPVNLIMVADFSRMGKSASEEKDAYAHADAAFIGQNVYLFCASEGLATVFRASIDKPALAKAMKLREDQKILFSQTVGYGKK